MWLLINNAKIGCCNVIYIYYAEYVAQYTDFCWPKHFWCILDQYMFAYSTKAVTFMFTKQVLRHVSCYLFHQCEQYVTNETYFYIWIISNNMKLVYVWSLVHSVSIWKMFHICINKNIIFMACYYWMILIKQLFKY